MTDGRPAGAGLLVFTHSDDGALYLCQQRGKEARDHPWTWDHTAGGRLEDGEHELDGALREYREEMGDPPELMVVHSITWLREAGSAWGSRRYTVFLAMAADTYAPKPDESVVADWHWLTFGEIMEKPLHPSFGMEIMMLAQFSAQQEP